MSGVYLTIGDKQYPSDDCVWMMYSSCGCASGVMTVRERFTVEDAEKDFNEGSDPRIWEREKAAGAHLELVTHADYLTRDFRSTCPHTPMWGIPEAPTPDGLVWRIKGGHWAHLRAVSHLFDATVETNWHEPVKSLCRRAEDRGSFKAENLLSHLSCAECWKRADELMAVQS